MEIKDFFMTVGVGLLAGVINTMAGGGSLLSMPLLIFMGLPPNVANATNRLAIFSQNVFGVAGFKSKGVSDFRYGTLLSITAIAGALIGAKVAVDISGVLFNKILAVVMVLVVIMTVTGKLKPKGLKQENTSRRARIIGFITFFFIGIYGGFIQAGVGFLIIAALTSINGFNLVKVNSIKMFVILLYTIGALGVFIYEDKLNWTYGIVLAIGNSTGAWFASRWSVDKGEKVVKIFLLIAVIGLAIKLWLK